MGKYCDLYPAEDEVLIKPIPLNKEIDGMKKNSGWIANLGNVDDKKASIPEDAKKYFFSNRGLVGYPSKIEGKSAKDINESLHRGHLMARKIICEFINPRIKDERMYPSERQRHNAYAQFKQSNCYFTDYYTRKGQGYFEKKIIDYLKSKKGEKGYVNYEVRALFKNASDMVPRANLLCVRFYGSCGLFDEQKTFCVVIPNMGSPENDNRAISGYKFSYEEGLEK